MKRRMMIFPLILLLMLAAACVGFSSCATEEHVHQTVDDPAVAPTCTTPGLTAGRHCPICHWIEVAQQPIPATGHSFATEWSQDETHHWHAATCGHGEAVERLPHAPVTDPAVAPTCEAGGLTEGSHCADCDRILVAQQPVEAVGHSFATDWSVDETEHWHAATCSHVTLRADVGTHTWQTVPGVAPTETASGLTDGVRCTVCGHWQTPQTEISPLGHEHTFATEWSQDETHHWLAATCGHDYAVNRLPHTPVTDPAVPPTCDTPGMTEGSHCADCHRILVAQQQLPAAHTYSEDWESDSSCHWHPTTCGHTDAIQRELHSFVEGVCQCGARQPAASEGLLITDGALIGIGACTDTVLVLPVGVKKIGTGALRGCTQLTAVILPSSVTYIGAGAFAGCTSLTMVQILSTEVWTAGTETVNVTDGENNARRLTGAWVDLTLRVKGSGTETPPHVFGSGKKES